MIPSVTLSVLFTALFMVTGCYSLLRWSALRAGVTGQHGDQLAELAHLLMSLRMINMTWTYGGVVSNTVQIVVFGALCAYFAARLIGVRDGRWTHRCPAPGFHLLMCVSMVWMVAAMPLLMGAMPTAGADSMADMPGMHTATTAAGGRPASTPAWAVLVTVGMAVLLVAGAAWWLRQLVLAGRPKLAPVIAGPVSAGPVSDGPVSDGPVSDGPVSDGPVSDGPVSDGPVSDGTMPANRTPRGWGLAPTTAAGAHLLMSVGMATMLLLML